MCVLTPICAVSVCDYVRVYADMYVVSACAYVCVRAFFELPMLIFIVTSIELTIFVESSMLIEYILLLVTFKFYCAVMFDTLQT